MIVLDICNTILLFKLFNEPAMEEFMRLIKTLEGANGKKTKV